LILFLCITYHNLPIVSSSLEESVHHHHPAIFIISNPALTNTLCARIACSLKQVSNLTIFEKNFYT